MSPLVPLGLYLLALIIRLLAASEIPFPPTEPSAYYVGVAHNLAAGEGLVTDAVWSYATPPAEVPRAAFSLWLPMSTFVSALGMFALGSSFWAAQVGNIVLGAAVAPLAWAIGREAARTHGLDGRRGRAVAITSGLLAAVLGPLVLGAAVPDSYTPFTVLVLMAALLVPRVLGVRDGRWDEPIPPTVVAGIGLGLAMGLAYLSRQEVVWLGLTVVLMVAWVLRRRPPGARLREAVQRLWPVVVGGLVVVLPWLMRNWLELGSPLPGQAIENMFLVENEDIYAFKDRPEAATYLAQGLATMLTNPLIAAWRNFLEVVAVPAFPVGLLGLIALVGLRRSPALRRPTALVALLLCALLTFVTTVLLFPVATLWGTFMHSSGPLLVALGVVLALGADALLARISRVRRWEKPNVIIAPIALVSVAALLMALQASLFAATSKETETRLTAVADSLESVAAAMGQAVPAVVITDRPMWLAGALGTAAIVLPDEDVTSVQELSEVFDAPWVVVMEEGRRYPGTLLDESARGCLADDPVRLPAAAGSGWLFRLAAECSTA